MKNPFKKTKPSLAAKELPAKHPEPDEDMAMADLDTEPPPVSDLAESTFPPIIERKAEPEPLAVPRPETAAHDFAGDVPMCRVCGLYLHEQQALFRRDHITYGCPYVPTKPRPYVEG